METKKMEHKPSVKAGKQNFINTLYSKIVRKVTGLFEPEEVEVTFEEDHGKVVSYTYTKVSHKQVA